MSDWYCEHGYFEGRECPDCDVPSYLPAVLPLVKERNRMRRDLKTRTVAEQIHMLRFEADHKPAGSILAAAYRAEADCLERLNPDPQTLMVERNRPS